MIPPLFPLLSGVTSLGTNPKRFFPHGQATQATAKPYATWQIVAGTPENYLGTLPDIDGVLIQVDVWADTQSSASAVADDIRNAFQTVMHMTSFGQTEKDATTNLYRYRMDFSYWVPR